MASRRTALAVFQVLLLVVSAASIGMAAGASVTTETATGETALSVNGEVTNQISSADGDAAPIRANLNSDTTDTIIVKLTEANIPEGTPPAEAQRLLKDHAKQTQQAAASVASNNAGMSIKQRLWLTNAIVVEVQPGADISQLAAADGVTEIRDNFEVSLPGDPGTSSDVSSTDVTATQTGYNATYGPEQINATAVWDQYGTMGEGAKVAVLDTGVDGDHPAIEESLEKFAEFGPTGDITASGVDEAHDTGGHGTHTSGIVVGDNSNGEYIGAAPNATLYHGLVLDGGSGTFAQIVAGMQWAVANDADVTSMSLGATGHFDEFIAPVRNSERAGTVVVASVGNAGPGTSGSPGNIYETLSVGATDANGEIASFSSGEVVYKSNFSSPPPSWPSSYTVPDVVAPGVSVLSSAPDDDYARISGTSMSAPYVSGAAALLVSAANNNPSADLLKSSLQETANAPAGADPTRYGDGIIDALAAADRVVTDQNVSVRVNDLSEPYLEPGENFTANLRVSNVDSVNVTLNSSYSNHQLADQSSVTVYVNGVSSGSGLPANLSVSPTASTDDFTVSIAVDEQRATPAFDVTFENHSSGDSLTATQQLKVHPDPLIVEDTANQSEINNVLSFAAPGTTVRFEGGTYTLNNTLQVPSELRIESNSSANVVFDSEATEAVVLNDGATLADVAVEGNYSTTDDTGVVAAGNSTTVENVRISKTAYGVYGLFADDIELRQLSISTTSAGDAEFPIGVALNNVADTTIAGTSIASSNNRNATGMVVRNSVGTTITDTSVLADAPDGISAAADAVELIGTDETIIRESSLTSEAGSALRTLGASETVVRNTTLEGSNVSAGVTGTVFAEATGYSVSSDTLDTLLDATATEHTTEVAGQTVTVHNLQHLSADEYHALSGITNQTGADDIAAQSVDMASSAIQEMNATERVEYANETLSDISREDIEALQSATQEVSTFTHQSLQLQDSTVTGEYAPVIALDADLRMQNTSVTDSSYSKWGVYAAQSDVYIEDSYINPTAGDVSYEAGIYNYGSYVTVRDSSIVATTGIETYAGEYFGGTYAERVNFEGKTGMTGFGGSANAYRSVFNTTHYGITQPYSDSYRSEFNSAVGILAEETYAQYNNFEDTSLAIQALDGYESSARMNWYGDVRGPSTTVESTGGAIVSDIEYDPFLTAPPAEANLSTEGGESEQGIGTQAFATDVVMEPGQAYSFAVPGPTEGNLSQMFNDFNGVIYGFDAESQAWYQITPGNDEQLDALDALLVVPDTTARAVIDFEDSDDPTKVPAARDMHEGWNFVGAPQYGNAEDAFAASSADPARVVNVYEDPFSQISYSDDYWTVYTMGSTQTAPEVSAFSGYFVYAEDNGTIAANIPRGISIERFIESINTY